MGIIPSSIVICLILPHLLGIKHTFFVAEYNTLMFSGIFFFIICLVPNQVTMSIISILSCHLFKFPQIPTVMWQCKKQNISASYPERFLCNCNYFWKLSLYYICYYSAMHQILNYEILFTFFKPCGLWSFIRVCQLNCASLKLSIQVTACSHISHSIFFWGWGFGTLMLTLNHYFQNEEGIFWNIFNVTALVLLLCLYDGKSCFACLFSFKSLTRGQLIFIKTKHHYQVSDHYILVLKADAEYF